MIKIKKLLFGFLVLIFFIITFNAGSSSEEKLAWSQEVTGQVELEHDYHLLVYQAEPEGIAAAVSAARQGLETALIMEREEPGGLFTYGYLNFLDLNYDRKNRSLNRGFFAEWHNLVGGGVSFQIEQAKSAFNQLLAGEENLTVYRNYRLEDVTLNQGELQAVQISRKTSSPSHEPEIHNLSAAFFIDASQNGDLAALTGSPYFFGGADIGQPDRYMPVTPVIKLKGIDRRGLKEAARSGRHGHARVGRDNAYGFDQVGKRYTPADPGAGLRGLNLVLQDRDDGGRTITYGYINALHFYQVEASRPELQAELFNRADEEARRVTAYLQSEVGGLDNIEYLGLAPEFYFRESRHFLTVAQVGVKEQLAAHIPKDTVALASYPLDYQAHAPGAGGFVYFNPPVYGIPLRSLIPKKVNNMLIVGRSSGFSSIAHSSGRIVPNGMTAAEGAGLAAAQAVKTGLSLEDIAHNNALMTEIQQATPLYSQINSRKIKNLQRKLVDPDYFEAVAELLSWGLVVGGYDNNFRLDEPISQRSFAYLLLNGLHNRRANIEYQQAADHLTALTRLDLDLTGEDAFKFISPLADYSADLSSAEIEAIYTRWKNYEQVEIVDHPGLAAEHLSRGQAYLLAVDLLAQFDLPADLKRYRGEAR
ncbi:MAG: FAD-dependent oxidoreductase [Bacillota bacterium]